MKRFLALAAILAFIAAGCSDKKDRNPCATPTVSVTPQGGGSVNGYVNNSGELGFGFVEVEYGPNGFSRGSGTSRTLTQNFQLSGLSNGTYDIYARGNCGGSQYSEWSAPASFIITGGVSSTCASPNSLSYSSSNEQFYWNSNSSANYFQVEYGTTGFTLGTGTQVTTNDEYYFLVSPSTGTYDYYVRANCGGSDWSPWAGPYSFVVN